MASQRIQAALERARADAVSPTLAPADGRPRARRIAIGDPQAPLDTFLRILDGHGLLGEDGRLKPDVQLVSMGDHFDWGGPGDRARAIQSALQLVAWLAAHPADQVVMLLGNHDLGRVCELADFNEASFAEAQAEADFAYRDDVGAEPEQRFQAKYPGLTDSEVLARDFAAFHPAQRDAVAMLLRARRFRAAHADGGDLLLCHAGVTREDLALLGLPPGQQHRAPDVADALNARLDAAVAGWTGGALKLAPMHEPGRADHPGGRGVFYHRPANPEGSPASDFDGPPRRRFDPRWMPEGLSQAVGHIRDNKCRVLLGAWAAAEPAMDGPLRYLRVERGAVRYARGVPEQGSPSAATMLFLDGGMNHVSPDEYELLDLKSRAPAPRG